METENNKLLYLDETKQLLKEKINYLGGNLTPESTFRSYSDALNNIYEKYPKVSDTGTDINLVNTKQGKITTELNPSEISQESTTGKQLFNYEDTTIVSRWTADNEGWLTISVNNTTSEVIYANYFTNNLNLNTSTDYLAVLEVKNVSGNGNLNIVSEHPSSQSNNYVTVSLNNLTNDTIYVYSFTTKASFEGITNGIRTYASVNPQQQSGSITCRISVIADTTVTPSTFVYQPFTGGIPAPNPDYPFPIHTVSGENNIKIENKNLFSSEMEQGSISASGVETTTTNRIRTTDYIEVQSNTQYTLSANTGYTTDYTIQGFIFEYDSNDTFIQRIPTNWTQTPITFTTNETTKKVKVILSFTKAINLVPSDIPIIQLEQGSTATDYTPHEEQNYVINLPVENLWGGFTFSKTSSDVSFVYNTNGTIVANGTASANASSMSLSEGGSHYITLEAGTYYLKGGLSLSKIILVFNTSGTQLASDVGSGATFTLSETTNVFIRCYISQGQVSNNDEFKVMISKTNASFTPYGTSALEYCKIGDYSDELIKTSGKNLWNSNIIQGGRLFLNGNYFNQNNYVSNETPIPVEVGKTYTLSANGYTSNNQAGFVFFNNGTFVSSLKQQSTTFTVPSGVNQVYCDLANGSVITPTSFSNFQLEEGSSATEYEPYGTNEWYMKKNIGKVVLDGSETWYLSVEGTNTNLYYNQRTQMSSDILSNYFIRNENLYTEDIEGIRGLPNNNRIWIRINKTIASNVNNFKTWLSTHNTTVYYVLNTPEYINITENYPTLVAQFENLNNAKSYNEQTNISQTNNDLPFIINTKALKKND